MNLQTGMVHNESAEACVAVRGSGAFASLLNQVQSARVRADQMGMRSSEIALRRAVIAMSNELGVSSGLESHELLFID